MKFGSTVVYRSTAGRRSSTGARPRRVLRSASRGGPHGADPPRHGDRRVTSARDHLRVPPPEHGGRLRATVESTRSWGGRADQPVHGTSVVAPLCAPAPPSRAVRSSTTTAIALVTECSAAASTANR